MNSVDKALKCFVNEIRVFELNLAKKITQLTENDKIV